MKETTQQTEKPKGLSNSLKYFFGVGDAGFNLMSNIETFYFMTFLTDLAAFSPAIAGLINSVFSIVDACLSWIYGGILNGTKAKKWGRYRSWLILVPWIVPFLYAFQFIRVSSNEMLSAVIIIAAAIASHVVWNIGYVANATLVSVVGKTPEDRATLASSRGTWNNIGSLLFSYLGLPLATLLAGFVGETNKFAAAAFCLGILMVLGYYAHFKMTDGYEEIETGNGPKAGAAKVSIPDMFKSLFANPQLMILMIADLAKWCVKFVTAAAAIYYFRDAMHNPGLMTPYLLAIGLAAIVGAFATRYLAKSLSNRTTAIISFVGMAVSLALIYVAYTSYVAVIALMTLAQFFYGVAYSISPALYADTVVYTTHKTGKNAAGWIMGLQNLPLKVGVFMRGTIVAACLAAVGWQKGIALEGAARQGMTVALGLVPAALCAIGAVLLVFGYKLTREKIAECQAAIDANK
ncbi:MAG: MFS transporter [Candidatus Faecousia sp.]|nr:MFS transporter [Candidatus Faecousia sp.]